MFGSRARRLDVCAQKSSHLCVMSLLGVPVSRFPSDFFLHLSSTPLTGSRSPPCASAPNVMYLDTWECQAAASTQLQQQADFPPCRDLGHQEIASGNSWQFMNRFDSRNSIRETDSFFKSESKGKRDRDQNVVQSLKDRGNLPTILERKAELAVRGERITQQTLYEAEAEVDAECWETKNWDTLRETIRSSNLNDFSCNKQIVGQIRVKEI